MSWSAMRRLRSHGLGVVVRHPEIDRLRRWTAIFVEFSAVQAVVQFLGVVTGIAVVRLLDTHGYALYTIANSVLAALVVLADSGIGTATLGIGGRVWQDSVRLGGVVSAARRTMRSLRNAVGGPVLLVFVWLLARNDASLRQSIVIAILVLLGGMLSLHNTIDMAVVRLMGNTRFIQTIGLASAGVRLAATMAFALFGLVVETAMLAVVIGWGLQCWVARRWTQRKVPKHVPIDQEVRRELRSVVKTQFPNSLNYVLQGQISIWLLSIFGAAGSVADLGAVTRISIIFSVLLATMQNVIVPRYARCQDSGRLGALYLQICGGFAVLVLVPVALVAVAPKPVLWILGPHYIHLPTELVLAVFSTSVGSLTGLAWSLNANRAWFPPSWIWIPIDLASQLCLALLIGVSTTRQVLTVSIFAGLILLVANVVAAGFFIRRFRRQAVATSTH